jgi:hypothetical protein
VKWSESPYGAYKLHDSKGNHLATVTYGMRSRNEPEHPQGPYEVHLMGSLLKSRSQDVESGMRFAMLALRQRFTRTLKELDDFEQSGEPLLSPPEESVRKARRSVSK